MKEEERSERSSWDTTEALEHVNTMISVGVAPVETHYEVDDIIDEFADPSALTAEHTEQHIERMERRLQQELDAADDAAASEPSPEPPSEPSPAPSSEADTEADTAPTGQAETAETAETTETVRFVQTQVSAAMEEQGKAEAPKRFWEKLTQRFRKPKAEETMPQAASPEEQKEEKREETRVAPEEPSARKKAGAHEETEEEEENVLSFPKDPLFHAKRLVNEIRDQAADFADNMYTDDRSDSAVSDEADFPGTDEEKIPDRPRHIKAHKVQDTIPDTSAALLAKRYSSGLRGLGIRTIVVIAIAALLLLVGIGAEQNWPLLGGLMQRRRVLAAVLTWGLAVCAALGLDVLWLAITAPFRGRMGLHTLSALAVLATLADGIVYAIPTREGPLPFAGIAALSLGFAMWGAYDRKRALYIACRAVSAASEPYRVTLDDNRWGENPAFDKVPGSAKDFGRQMQGMDGSIAIARIVTPFLLLAAVAGGIAAAVLSGNTWLTSWCLSTALIASAPLGSLLCYAQPLLRVTCQLDRYGAVLAGWDGAASMTGSAGFLMKDTDLFPQGSVVLTDCRYFGTMPEEQVVSCTASVLRQAGCSLAKPFEDQLKLQGGFLRPVENLEWSEPGGFIATIRGHRVILARDGLLNLLHIPIPEGARVRSAMYCVVDGRVQGMFRLRYTLPHYVIPSLIGLIRERIVLVLATRDFNVTPGMLANLKLEDGRHRDVVPTQKMEYPVAKRRKELSEPHQPHNQVLGALVLREGVGAYADAVLGGRCLVAVTRINTVLTLIESLLGIVLTVYLASQMVFDTLCSATVLVFLLLLLIPNLILSGNADRF